MKKYLVALVVLAGVVAYMAYTPSAASRVEGLRVDLASGELQVQGEIYEASWGEVSELEGDARLVATVHFAAVPVITHDLALTSGDYSDPERVKLTSRGGGNYRWQARERPEGSLLLLHLIPATPAALAQVEALAEGTPVTLRGRKANPSLLTRRSDRDGLRLNHDNHAIFLLDEVRVRGGR